MPGPGGGFPLARGLKERQALLLAFERPDFVTAPALCRPPADERRAPGLQAALQGPHGLRVWRPGVVA